MEPGIGWSNTHQFCPVDMGCKAGNNFRCDTRLKWMFALRNSTRSFSVRLNLERVICYLEVGTLPPRLDDQTVTPAYETTTLGIGPMTKLFALMEHELPDPMTRYMQTVDPDCDDEEGESGTLPEEVEGGRRRGRGRGRGRKKADRIKTQNDMATPNDEDSEGEGGKAMRNPPVPVQEESRSFDSGSSIALTVSLVPVLIISLALL
ncbi:hypothetical protein SK128_019001 [Halocaridina rubra]|uniref:Uncharacterized protein n=1 Tax=Halocaridina rubra TaxID=373956 RepID=A0AAN8ZVD6_HALRR